MTSVVSLRASASVPVDLPQQYLAKPGLLALSKADAALADCRRLRDHLRRIGLPAGFVRMAGESAVFDRATPFVRRIAGFGPLHDEMMFERTTPSCYSCKPFNGMSAGG